MSMQHALAVMSCQEVKGTAKAVLSNLAIRADENDKCWPGREKIAEDVGISIRAVSGALKTLSETGLIEIERKQYGQVFTLQMCRICTSQQISDVQDIPSDVQDLHPDVQISSSDVQDIPPNIQEGSINKTKKEKARPAQLKSIGEFRDLLSEAEPHQKHIIVESFFEEIIKARGKVLFKTFLSECKPAKLETSREAFVRWALSFPEATGEDLVFWVERSWPKCWQSKDQKKPSPGHIATEFVMPPTAEDQTVRHKFKSFLVENGKLEKPLWQVWRDSGVPVGTKMRKEDLEPNLDKLCRMAREANYAIA